MTKINDGGPVLLALQNGGHAIISEVDFPVLSAFKWRRGGNGYAYRCGANLRGVQTLLHRIVLDAPRGKEVHHRNGDKLDCRRENLELTTPSGHQEYHKSQLIERNLASRKYPLTGVCKHCGNSFIRDPNHRGRQTCCSKDCAIRIAITARKERANAAA